MSPHRDARPDLVEALIQSCWVVEAARANVFARWGGEFADDAVRTRDRERRLRQLLTDRGHPVPEQVEEAHTFWVQSLVGPEPDSVPLGAGILQRFGHWTDVYMEPYLGEGAEEFRALGEGELRFPVPPRTSTEDEIILAVPDAPPGRRFAVFTDIHVGSVGTEELARQAVEDINALEPEFVVCPGDITDDGEPDQFEGVHDVLEGLDAPYHAVLGNHDAVQRSTRDAAGHDLFEKAFGSPADDVVLEIDDLQIALVDSTDPTPSPFPDWDLARGGFREDAGGVNNGAFTTEQLERLASVLDPARPTLVVMHHELQPFGGFPPVMFGVQAADSDAFFETLGGHRIIGVVAGHTHRSALTGVGDGSVPQLEVPSLKDWPYCYTTVGVEPDRVHVVWRQISNRELVWDRGQKVPPIYLGYIQGPLSRVHHVFEL